MERIFSLIISYLQWTSVWRPQEALECLKYPFLYKCDWLIDACKWSVWRSGRKSFYELFKSWDDSPFSVGKLYCTKQRDNTSLAQNRNLGALEEPSIFSGSLVGWLVGLLVVCVLNAQRKIKNALLDLICSGSWFTINWTAQNHSGSQHI